LRRIHIPLLILALALPTAASTVGSVRGVIHDPQHRPVQNAMVMLKAKSSDWSATTNSDANGEFIFNAVPLGEYSVTVAGSGFDQAQQDAMVISSSQPVLHFALNVAGAKETVSVTAPLEAPSTDSATPTTVVDRLEIARTPGADGSNSLAMITDYVPGAYVTHDQLHIRGGHQTSWLVDGVPVPNTNIASNVGPQFDPKDIDYLEVSRGSYGAEFGDRTYGVFNIAPRTGFERNREAELFLPDQRPAQLRQPHPALRLVRQRQRQSRQSRHSNPRPASRARRRKRIRRLRIAHLQSQSQEPAAPRDFSAKRFLSSSLRSFFR
jgi:Carboxypeptidase regulatory-like domain/TonB-dependent Receptor Plug Domain